MLEYISVESHPMESYEITHSRQYTREDDSFRIIDSILSETCSVICVLPLPFDGEIYFRVWCLASHDYHDYVVDASQWKSAVNFANILAELPIQEKTSHDWSEEGF